MSAEIISILVLAAIFVIGTVRPVNLGALAIVAAFVMGVTTLKGDDLDEKTDAVFAGFPGELFTILVGVTLLFAIAKQNGTVDWLVHAALRVAGGRIGLIPWIMFLIPALFASIGALVPAAVAIIAPIGSAFALRHRINPLMMGIMIAAGGTAGGFSPMSVYGSITNGVVDKAGLEGSPTLLMAGSFIANTLLALFAFLRWGGPELLRRRAADTPDDRDGDVAAQPAAATEPIGPPGGVATLPESGVTTTGSSVTTAEPRLDRDRVLTLTGLVTLAVGALFFDLNVGLVAITVATALTVISPPMSRGAVEQVAWPTVLLVCGIVLYVSVMEEIGTIDWLGAEVAGIGTPLLAALVICFIGAVVSAFASTTGILGALIPLAVPFLNGSDAVGAVGLITALAISSSVVDTSPFSTSGALVLANAQKGDRDTIYKGLLKWGFSMVVIAPIATWAVLVLPGWL